MSSKGCPGPKGNTIKKIWGCDTSLCNKEQQKKCATKYRGMGYKIERIIIDEVQS